MRGEESENRELHEASKARTAMLVLSNKANRIYILTSKRKRKKGKKKNLESRGIGVINMYPLRTRLPSGQASSKNEISLPGLSSLHHRFEELKKSASKIHYLLHPFSIYS